MPIDPEFASALRSHSMEIDDPTAERLQDYAKLMWQWNEQLNLTRHTTWELFVGRDLRAGGSMQLLIADDHPIVLDGLEALLNGSGVTVVHRCRDGEEVLRTLGQHSPDVLILDIHMPHLSGLEVLRRLRAEGHSAKVVLLTSSMDDRDLVEAIGLKVEGILLKRTASHRLLECLQAVTSGECWIDPEAMQRLVQARRRFDAAAHKTGPLAPRELDITRLVASGLRNKEIAYKLSVSEATVKMRLHTIYEKLSLANRTELALFARDNGLL